MLQTRTRPRPISQGKCLQPLRMAYYLDVTKTCANVNCLPGPTPHPHHPSGVECLWLREAPRPQLSPSGPFHRGVGTHPSPGEPCQNATQAPPGGERGSHPFRVRAPVPVAAPWQVCCEGPSGCVAGSRWLFVQPRIWRTCSLVSSNSENEGRDTCLQRRWPWEDMPLCQTLEGGATG